MAKIFKDCVICNQKLEQRDSMFKRIGVCSKVCHQKRKEKLLSDRVSKYNKIPCIVCGTIFQPTQPTHVRCSKECVKAFHKNNYISSKTDFNLFKRDNFTCIYCGKSSIEDGVKLTIEHITPIVLSGKTHIDNLITACDSCNRSKNATELPDDIKKRVYDALMSRNNNLSILEISAIGREIDSLQYSHFYRENKTKKRLPLPNEDVELKFKS